MDFRMSGKANGNSEEERIKGEAATAEFRRTERWRDEEKTDFDSRTDGGDLPYVGDDGVCRPGGCRAG